MKLTKKAQNVARLKQQEAAFCCPHCQAPLRLIGEATVGCENKHHFDFSKTGVLHLLTKQVPTFYDHALFTSRQLILEEYQLFAPVYDAIAPYLPEENQALVVDMGTGEGTHLKEIIKRSQVPLVPVGLDIAKEGIQLAAKRSDEAMWVVADLAKAPFQPKSIAMILNLLSPSQYEVFDRLLQPGGRLLKVVPDAFYLKEIRELLFAEEEKAAYSNQLVVDHFFAHYPKASKERLTYEVTLPQAAIPHLLAMTPLTRHATTERIKAVEALPTLTVTVDCLVLVSESM